MAGHVVPKCVVLDRIEPGWAPPYCVHGRATCIGCDDWVYLGSETVGIVQSGEAAPLCKQCAQKYVPPGTRPLAHLDDHRRADGPHA